MNEQDEQRAVRIGENEAIYRAINEKIEGLNRTFGVMTESMAVVCECGMLECAEQIQLDVPAYERVRSDPTMFVVLPGHELPSVEEVCERHDGYLVVCKDKGTHARVARETDPRS